jgi:hypothetical protein
MVEFPLDFPDSREFEVETRSQWTACTTTQSHVWGNFPAAGEKPPEGGMRRERLVSGTWDLVWEGSLGALFSGLEFPFPGNGDCGRQRQVRLSWLRRSKAQHLALPRPFCRHVAEARHSHPTR